MDVRKENESGGAKNRTTVERTSDREVVVRRTFDAPVHLVFEAWSKAEHFKRWWVPKSMPIPLLSCEMDVRTGGTYRLVFGTAGSPPMAFFGKYLEVIPNARIVWTNEESGDSSVTTVTFEQQAGKTLVVMHELHPSKEALDAAAGASEGAVESLEQLDEFLATAGGR